MPSSLTRKRLTLLLALCLSLPLTACGTDRVRFIAPPLERTATVDPPTIPDATTPCSFDPTQLCNTDEETAQALATYDAALAEANRRLAWLRNFFSTVPTKSPVNSPN